jgi:hypothetical protein
MNKSKKLKTLIELIQISILNDIYIYGLFLSYFCELILSLLKNSDTMFCLLVFCVLAGQYVDCIVFLYREIPLKINYNSTNRNVV